MTFRYICHLDPLREIVRETTGHVVKDDGNVLVIRPNGGCCDVAIARKDIVSIRTKGDK